ncbi:MAG: hypothetical protein ACODAQ_12175 [Phycisphaeraceae bacterium]
MAQITINITSDAGARAVTISIDEERVCKAIMDEVEAHLLAWRQEFNALLVERGLTAEAALAIMRCCPTSEPRHDGNGNRKWRWSR